MIHSFFYKVSCVCSLGSSKRSRLLGMGFRRWIKSYSLCFLFVLFCLFNLAHLLKCTAFQFWLILLPNLFGCFVLLRFFPETQFFPESEWDSAILPDEIWCWLLNWVAKVILSWLFTLGINHGTKPQANHMESKPWGLLGLYEPARGRILNKYWNFCTIWVLWLEPQARNSLWITED